ncbi:MAG: hypothetical protein Kow0027_19630 [Saprospiraceae bacterium]|jgi:predicted transcriptional regulator
MAAQPDSENKPVHYVDFDLLENVKLRISLKLLLAIAGTIVAVTTTTVIGYNNIKKDLGQIDDQVKGIRDDFKEVAEENKKAIETLEITDEALTRELEALKKRVEVLEEKVQEK